jgi:NADPH:quinone reductase-like Zn-dependent oxidoreductase
MYAVRIHQPGGPEQLIYEEVPTPRPGPGEVQVALRGAALNHRDLRIRLGLQLTESFPLILGSDGAGLVAEVGAGVSRVRAGDEVVILPTMFCNRCRFCLAGQHSLCVRFEPAANSGILGGPADGTYAEYIVVPEINLFPRPRNLSWEESAAFPLAALTAYRLLASRADLRAGAQVLIHGIGGGVATFALQIARAHGARAIVTSSSDQKLARARELGAEAGVNYRGEGWEQAVLDWTGGQGVDLVVETVGAATWPSSLRLVRRDGRIAICGATAGQDAASNLRHLFWNQLTILGTTMGTAEEFARLLELIAAGQIKPVVDRVFPLREAAAAHARLDAAEQFGKIVLAP